MGRPTVTIFVRCYVLFHRSIQFRFRLVGYSLHFDGPIFYLTLLLMFASGPLMLYSGFVGYSRMWDIPDKSLRRTGKAIAIFYFAMGLINLLIPISMYALSGDN